MLRKLLLIVPVFALVAAACGGGGDDGGDGNDASGDAASGPTPTPTPLLLPTPPTADDNEVILSVSAGEKSYTPTLAEFKNLPKTKIDADGNKEGVSVAALAEQVSAGAETYVTVQGYRSDGRMISFVREPLSAVGAESVLVLDEKGRLSLFSSKLPKDSWLINVQMVTFS